MKENTKAELIGAALMIPFLALTLAYVVFTGGFVLSRMWLWHAVPFGLPVIGWKTFSAGLLFKGVLLRKTDKFEESKTKAPWWFHATSIAAPWVSLFVAWVLR